MPRILLYVCLFMAYGAYAQQQVTIPLTHATRDERFEKFNLNVALFELKSDTILSWDFEGLKEPQPLVVKKPLGSFDYYAYGYLFFGGNTKGYNPGFITIIVGNPYHANPTLFADLNNNLDFTDDDVSFTLPARGDTALFRFCLPGTGQCAQVRLSRHKYDANFKYKDLMNEFYTMTYPQRKFIGMEHCYREQRYQVLAGTLSNGEDTFRVGLYDGNYNGIYNEADSDRFVIAELTDTVFYPYDELHSSVLSHKPGSCFIDKNGKQFEYVSAAENGSAITLKVLDNTSNASQVKAGKKLPRFKYITWQGERKKIARLRRYQLFIYFGNPQAKSFTADTIALRQLAEKHKDKLRVIGFIEVQKSYELRIYGQYWNLNWMLAYKDKELNRRLGIRGLPSSIYTKKRRRVVQYNLSPAGLLKQLDAQSKP
jgi:hypothetical protein